MGNGLVIIQQRSSRKCVACGLQEPLLSAISVNDVHALHNTQPRTLTNGQEIACSTRKGCRGRGCAADADDMKDNVLHLHLSLPAPLSLLLSSSHAKNAHPRLIEDRLSSPRGVSFLEAALSKLRQTKLQFHLNRRKTRPDKIATVPCGRNGSAQPLNGGGQMTLESLRRRR